MGLEAREVAAAVGHGAVSDAEDAFEKLALARADGHDSGLEQARDSQKAVGNAKEVEELEKKIKALNDKHNEPEGESSFSVFS